MAAAAFQAAGPAQADDASTLTVVGTSDVYDSNLVQSVIKPGFEAYYKAQTGKDITLNYISKGTGAALAYARQGSASAAIVHAASIENQFVADGYSTEQYGRAVFFGDYVLLGPKGDPAGVLNGAQNDIATAFEKIAAAGAANKAKFVSRSGTPGTTVQEHAIWALTNPSPTKLCDVSSANGGGKTPSATDGACPDPVSAPEWYQSANRAQGANVLAGDACTTPTTDDSSTNDCYVFTDRGTFQFLRSQGSINQLQIVTRQNAATARGGPTLLTNSFHAYAVNPSKVPANSQLNGPGAQAFLEYMTSPAAQASFGKYLAGDADGAPFNPSARPIITYRSLPAGVHTGHKVTLQGSLVNPTPGTPTLANQAVSLYSAPTKPANATYTRVATGRTNAVGGFSLSYTPSQTRRYRVESSATAVIENSSLNPVFGDLLQGTSVTTNAVQVISSLSKTKAVNNRRNHVVVTGHISPKTIGKAATISLYVRTTGKHHAYHRVATRHLKAGVSSYKVGFTLKKGKYRYKMRFANTGYVNPDYSNSLKLRVR